MNNLPPTNPRARVDVALEYSQVCAEIGNLIFQSKYLIPEKIDELNARLRGLVTEAAEAESREKAAAQANAGKAAHG